MTDTIFALSSGSPPAAIAVIRLSGPGALAAVHRLAGELPEPRRAAVRILRNGDCEVLDRALVLTFPGPGSATGEDCAELQCHGGRAVVGAVLAALAVIPGLRAAEPGEFTRRAFANGVIDLAQAEALGDLLAAETELQRRVAQAGVGGLLSLTVEAWRDEALALSAMVEAALDFSDEDDVEGLPASFGVRCEVLRQAIGETLARPSAERLREGVRVVMAGPPNAGKSSLFNALLGDGAAIVSSMPGTTRDVIERPVAFGGVPFVLVDLAGFRENADNEIERWGIERAYEQLERADIVLWLGKEGEGPGHAIEIAAKCDMSAEPEKGDAAFRVSAKSGEGLAALEAALVERARHMLPKPGQAPVNARQAALLREASDALANIDTRDLLIMAESLRWTRHVFDRLIGRSGTEDMLDVLFGRFCIGK